MSTPLCRPGTGMMNWPTGRILKYDHKIITTERMTHGIHAANDCCKVSEEIFSCRTADAGAVGLQKRRKVTVAAIDTDEATISVAYGPHKLETRNCVSANVAPATSAAGQARRRPLPLATTHTR